MKSRQLCSGVFHPKLVTSPYHGFLNVNTPPNSQSSKRHSVQRNTQVPVGKHNNRQHASPHHEVATDVKQMPIRPIIIIIKLSTTRVVMLNRYTHMCSHMVLKIEHKCRWLVSRPCHMNSLCSTDAKVYTRTLILI